MGPIEVRKLGHGEEGLTGLQTGNTRGDDDYSRSGTTRGDDQYGRSSNTRGESNVYRSNEDVDPYGGGTTSSGLSGGRGDYGSGNTGTSDYSSGNQSGRGDDYSSGNTGTTSGYGDDDYSSGTKKGTVINSI